MTLHDAAIGQTFIFYDTEVAVVFTIFLAGDRAQKH
jgi:hypothetical protein